MADWEAYYSLLLDQGLPDEAVAELLGPVGFADWRAASRHLVHLGHDPQARAELASVLPVLFTALADAASPDRVLVNLERFLESAADAPAICRYLAGNPRALEILITLFASSQFLTEILLRNPEYLEELMALRSLSRPEGVADLLAGAQAAALTSGGTTEQLDGLRRYQRWQLLRIGVCDLLGLFDLPTVTAQLSNLADALVRACLAVVSADGPVQQGHPPEGFAVLAMGKLGGQELNYSSDIDLCFLAASSSAAHSRLAERLIDGLAAVSHEGFLYRVDMRLRPWGRVGALVSSPEAYVAYLENHARSWEKQALLKARVIAGDQRVGGLFLRQVEPLLFDSVAEVLQADVMAMKERTEARLIQQGRVWGEVKLGEGSIRDVEFVTQYLQLVHGGRRPEVRSRNTLGGLERLAQAGLLAPDAHRILTEGYVFLRTIEHHLQMMHYRQTHALPDDVGAQRQLARRLGFGGPDAGDQFVSRYEQHRAAIRSVYLEQLGSDRMSGPTDYGSAVAAATVRDHMARMDPSYAATFSAEEIAYHAVLADRLDDEHLVEVGAIPLADGRWRVTIVAYDYPGELSLICGLLFAYGFSIVDGNIFTYEPLALTMPPDRQADTRQKIVDVLSVRPEHDGTTGETWARYEEDLADLLRLMHAGQRREARGELAKRVAVGVHELVSTTATLYPVDIEIDNEASDRYTVLRIDAPDTIGFLYEFSNALAYHRVYIARVTVNSVGDRVQDTLYVTDSEGEKITSPERQRQLRAATVLIKHFTHLLPRSPNPETALLHFREFIRQLFQRPNWPDELASLDNADVLNALARLLGVSDFLWDDFLRMQHANLFPVVQDVDALATAKSRPQLQRELEESLRPVHDGPQPPSEEAAWRETVNAFKDREMFRIDMRHILGHTTFWNFSAELTDLTEVVVNAVYHLCHEDLRSVYGAPCLEAGGPSQMVVCALGKCGGRELGFASDIELMFVYAGNGPTMGPQTIATSEFYERLVQNFVSAIRARREGIFQVDLQLRPYGKAGSLAVSLEAFRRYYAPDGPAWAYERQALVKLRPIAGDHPLGQRVAALRDEFVYDGQPFDVTAMRAMRERQLRHLVTGGTFNAKYSPGGLVDAEYLVQALQISHGSDHPGLRVTNIREAMAALAEADALTREDYARLNSAHTFLRLLIDGLRMVRGNARELTVPLAGSEEFAFLARRLNYGNDVARLSADLAFHTGAVQALCGRLL